MADKYFCGKNLCYDGMEDSGFYEEGDNIVQRCLYFKLPIEPSAYIVSTQKIMGEWYLLATHPKYEETEDGNIIPVHILVDTGRGGGDE